MRGDVQELEERLRETPADAAHARERVDLLAEISRRLRGVDHWKQVEEFGREALELSEKYSYEAGRAKALTMLAFSHYSKSEHRVALDHAFEAREIFERLQDSQWLPEPMTVMFLCEWSLGNYDRAMNVGLEAMRLFEASGNEEGIAWSYVGAGGLANEVGDYQQALTHHLKAVELFQKQGEALGLARAYAGLGVVYRSLGEAKASLEVLRQSLELFRRLGNRMGEARALNDIGVTLQDGGEYAEALACHEQALRIREETETPGAQITSLLNLGRVYLGLDRDAEAEAVLERALGMAEKSGLKPKVYQVHHELATLCAKRREFEKALQHHEAFHRIRDLVFSEETSTRLKNLQISYETERSRREAEIYRLKNVELAQLLEEFQGAQMQLVQSEKMAALGDLVAGVAHELNSPLGVMVSSSQSNAAIIHRVREMAQCMDSPPIEKALAVFDENNAAIATAAARMRRIVQSLKGFARIDESEFQVTDVRRGLEETLTLLEPVYRDRIEVVRNYEEVPAIGCYAGEMNQVFRVLLKNAIEAIEGKGTITIRTWRNGKSMGIEIGDTGRGMTSEQIGRLFHPSFRSTATRVEARMGLFAAYHTVRKHGGEIKVESEAGKGSRFTILMPLNEGAPVATERVPA